MHNADRQGSCVTVPSTEVLWTVSLITAGPITKLFACVFITAGPMIKLCAGGEGDSEGHVL
jgi:hypothetical protein